MALSQLEEFRKYGSLISPNDYELIFYDDVVGATEPINFSISDVDIGSVVDLDYLRLKGGASVLNEVVPGSSAKFSFYERDSFTTLTYFLGWLNSFYNFKTRSVVQYEGTDNLVKRCDIRLYSHPKIDLGGQVEYGVSDLRSSVVYPARSEVVMPQPSGKWGIFDSVRSYFASAFKDIGSVSSGFDFNKVQIREVVYTFLNRVTRGENRADALSGLPDRIVDGLNLGDVRLGLDSLANQIASEFLVLSPSVISIDKLDRDVLSLGREEFVPERRLGIDITKATEYDALNPKGTANYIEIQLKQVQLGTIKIPPLNYESGDPIKIDVVIQYDDLSVKKHEYQKEDVYILGGEDAVG